MEYKYICKNKPYKEEPNWNHITDRDPWKPKPSRFDSSLQNNHISSYYNEIIILFLKNAKNIYYYKP